MLLLLLPVLQNNTEASIPVGNKTFLGTSRLIHKVTSMFQNILK